MPSQASQSTCPHKGNETRQRLLGRLPVHSHSYMRENKKINERVLRAEKDLQEGPGSSTIASPPPLTQLGGHKQSLTLEAGR